FYPCSMVAVDSARLRFAQRCMAAERCAVAMPGERAGGRVIRGVGVTLLPRGTSVWRAKVRDVAALSWRERSVTLRAAGSSWPCGVGALGRRWPGAHKAVSLTHAGSVVTVHKHMSLVC